jgi:hypothetical protein
MAERGQRQKVLVKEIKDGRFYKDQYPYASLQNIANYSSHSCSKFVTWRCVEDNLKEKKTVCGYPRFNASTVEGKVWRSNGV